MNVRYIKRKTNDPVLIKELARSVGCSERLADLLLARNINTAGEAAGFLKPRAADFNDPYLMPDMKAAVKRIEAAIKDGERIVVYGDYDCDGVCAAAILYSYLRERTEAYYYIPARKDGYGLSADALDRIAENVFPDLLITVDCGITSSAETDYCKELGIDIIITDHHTPQEILPDAPILNPKTCGYPCELCGAGVAFKLVEALAGTETALKYIDLAAIATVGDIVPLTGENRAIVALGLKELSGNVKRKGLKRLFTSLKLERVTASDISFMIAPRLNAAGRMGLADRALELLVSDDAFDIDCLIKELNSDNAERQSVLNDITADVYSKLKDYPFRDKRSIIIADSKWDGGILGIACSKLAGEFNRPVVLFSENGDGIVKGSARSIPGVNIYDIMAKSEYLYKAFGGHAQAAGVSMESRNLEEFIKNTEAALSEYPENLFFPSVVYDAEIAVKPDMKEIKEICALEPFGEGNPKPLFLLTAAQMRFVRIKDTAHIKERDGSFETVGFNMAEQTGILNSPAKKRLLLNIDNCAYNNTEYLKGVVQGCCAEPPEQAFDKAALLEAYLTCGADKRPYPADGADIKTFGKDKLESIIKDTDKLYGTAFVAYDDGAAAEFYKLFNGSCDKFLSFSFGTPESKNPYNRLILSPKRGIFDYYDRIIFLDKPLFDIIDRPSAKTVMVNGAENPLDGVLKASGITDAVIRKAYIFIRYFIKENGTASDLNEMYLKSVKDKSLSYLDFLISFSVFAELGLIRLSTGFKPELTEAKTNLDNSLIFQMCKNL
ncbi:MAG: single-stranded-DNA-specific exonuclease RecJ [Clostridiales bacterium]|jgi:single-stranded-DNA-specific exonuclease|nr:single-stranded-DNA-specific exonuclease RecJ [Clostridiales bacterium]